MLEWLAGEIQKSPCLSFPNAEVTSTYHCYRHFHVGFVDQAGVLMLVREVFYALGHLPILKDVLFFF